MMNRISVKIVLSLVGVLTLIMVISTYLIVEQRSQVLREELLVKASSLAKIGAKALEVVAMACGAIGIATANWPCGISVG